jgi:hypothetical protein
VSQPPSKIPPPRVGDDARLWRAVDVFRCATPVYAFLLYLPKQDRFVHPFGGWAVLIAMAAWTGYLAELGWLAGEQEARLRAMVSSGPAHLGADGEADVRALLGGMSGRQISVSGPAGPVLLPGKMAAAVVAAVSAALDNVRRHAGKQASAWVLVEEEDDLVTVTVRDDGVGIPDGRLWSSTITRCGATRWRGTCPRPGS